MPDRSAWSQSCAPSFTVDEHGQLRWADNGDEVLTDSETRRSPYGDVLTLRQVWNRDRTRLQRLVIEGAWEHGPAVFVEARRPHGGWRGDELGRLMLAVLTFGVVP